MFCSNKFDNPISLFLIAPSPMAFPKPEKQNYYTRVLSVFPKFTKLLNLSKLPKFSFFSHY